MRGYNRKKGYYYTEKDIMPRRKRGGKKGYYDMTLTSFEYLVAVGRKAEKECAVHLANHGFNVVNISTRKMYDGRYFPFDLLAISPEGIPYIMDVKRQEMDLSYKVFASQMARWRSFQVSAIKLVMFQMSGWWFRYVRVCDIEKLGEEIEYSNGTLYYIPVKNTNPIEDIMPSIAEYY